MERPSGTSVCGLMLGLGKSKKKLPNLSENEILSIRKIMTNAGAEIFDSGITWEIRQNAERMWKKSGFTTFEDLDDFIVMPDKKYRGFL